MNVSPVRSNALIVSLIILPVGVFNFLFERLEDDDDDYDGLVAATVTCLSNVCTFIFLCPNSTEQQRRVECF